MYITFFLFCFFTTICDVKVVYIDSLIELLSQLAIS